VKYLIDAQLPYLLAEVLRQRNFDVMHTDDLPERERTGDQYIRTLAAKENRVVITKDTDFQDSYLLFKVPPKLLLLTTGNIKNRKLLDLFRATIDEIDGLFINHSFVELNQEAYLVHE
jgi:predicted nuclease of predicted toxin-antitoxin system